MKRSHLHARPSPSGGFNFKKLIQIQFYSKKKKIVENSFKVLTNVLLYSLGGLCTIAEEADIDYAFLRLQKYFTSCFIYLLFVS